MLANDNAAPDPVSPGAPSAPPSSHDDASDEVAFWHGDVVPNATVPATVTVPMTLRADPHPGDRTRDKVREPAKADEGNGKDDKKDDGGKDEKKSSKDDEGKDNKEKKDGGDGGEDHKPKSKWPLVILAIVVVLAIAAGVVYWLLHRDEESTDDAYTEGNSITIAPKVSGYVVERHIDDNTFVKAGDVMLRIDPRDYIASRDQARANVALAREQLVSAQIDLEMERVKAPASLDQARAQLEMQRASQTNAQREDRRQRSVDPRATTQSNVDQANTQLQSANANVASAVAQVATAALVPQNIASSESAIRQRQAQLDQAVANLASAELNVSYTEIRASTDGRVTKRNFDVGTYAQAGQQIFYLVPPDVWIVANYKETQLTRMRPGQKVEIDIDAFPKMKLKGHIESIQEGSGSRFSTFPAENATGNFVKIVRRVPVKILIDSGLDPNLHGLPLGLSVEPVVTVK